MSSAGHLSLVTLGFASPTQSRAGSDEKIFGAKIDLLGSETKTGVPRADTEGGAAGSDYKIDQARIDPVGGSGVGQNSEPHADDQGVVGRDENIQAAKIDPFTAASENAKPQSGLQDQVDAARIEPLTRVREQ